MIDKDILIANLDLKLADMGYPPEIRILLPWDKVDPSKSFDENLQMLLNEIKRIEEKWRKEIEELTSSKPMECLFNQTYAELEKDVELILEECMECKKVNKCPVPRTIRDYIKFLMNNEVEMAEYRKKITRLVRQTLKDGYAPIVLTKASGEPIGKYLCLDRDDVVLFVSPKKNWILTDVDELEIINIEKQGYDYVVGKYGGKYRFR